MKKILVLPLLLVMIFSCSKKSGDTIAAENKNKLKGVTVDFRQVPYMTPSVTFKGTEGQGVYTFSIQDGQLQTKQLPADGNYVATFSFLDCDPGCSMNVEYRGISVAINNASQVADTISSQYVMIMICGMPSGRK